MTVILILLLQSFDSSKNTDWISF